MIRNMPMGVYQTRVCGVCAAEARCIMHELYSFGKRTKCFDIVKFNSLVFQSDVAVSCLVLYLLSKDRRSYSVDRI